MTRTDANRERVDNPSTRLFSFRQGDNLLLGGRRSHMGSTPFSFSDA